MVDSGARAEVARSHNDSHLCVGPSIRANPGHIHQPMNYSLAFGKVDYSTKLHTKASSKTSRICSGCLPPEVKLEGGCNTFQPKAFGTIKNARIAIHPALGPSCVALLMHRVRLERCPASQQLRKVRPLPSRQYSGCRTEAASAIC